MAMTESDLVATISQRTGLTPLRVTDMLDFLRQLLQSSDDDAIRRVLALPKRGRGEVLYEPMGLGEAVSQARLGVRDVIMGFEAGPGNREAIIQHPQMIFEKEFGGFAGGYSMKSVMGRPDTNYIACHWGKEGRRLSERASQRLVKIMADLHGDPIDPEE
jgi:hypothetical protein